MKNKLLVHLASGFSSTVLIVLVIQICLTQSGQRVVAERFAAGFANDAAAMLVQLLLVGLIGAAFAGAALVFDVERWSYLKQGAIHLLLTAAVWVPVALICWAPISGKPLCMAAGGWVLTYAINWTIQYFISRKRVRELNERIREYRRAGEKSERD